MIITNAQLEFFDKKFVEIFEQKMIDFLGNAYPDKFNQVGLEIIKKNIHAGIEISQNYDMDTEREISKMIQIIIFQGEDFDKIEKWSEILNDETMSPEDRLDMIISEIKI